MGNGAEDVVMPKFSYVALDTRGKEISGVLESENTTAAVSRIREMGYFPTNVAEADKVPAKKGAKTPGGSAPGGGKAPAKKGIGSLNLNFGSGKVKTKLLTAFTRQLATLIDAGLPLLRGLDVLRLTGRKERHASNAPCKQIAESVEGCAVRSGEALARSIRRYSTACTSTWCAPAKRAVCSITALRAFGGLKGKGPEDQEQG